MKDLDLEELANVTGGFSAGQLPPGAPPPYNPFAPDPRIKEPQQPPTFPGLPSSLSQV